MRFRVEYTATAGEELRRLAPGPRRLVRRYVRLLAGDWSGLDIITLDGHPDTLRLIADGYRVLFRRDGTDPRVLTIIRVSPRATAYAGFERPTDG